MASSSTCNNKNKDAMIPHPIPISILPPQIQHHHPPPNLIFSSPFSCGPHTVPTPKTVTANFLDDRPFFDSQPPHFHNQWDANTRGNEDNDSEDDEDEEDEDVNNIDRIVSLAEDTNRKCDNIQPSSTTFGAKAGYLNQSANVNGINSMSNSGGEGRDGRGAFYTQYLNGMEGTSGLSSGHKDNVAVDDGCGFSGRKEVDFLSDSGEPLRAILSDPITGTLMDDAMILPCGHSFGSGGMQKVVAMKACYTCSGPVSEDSIAPNLTLRLAVQAFRREDELYVNRTSKRRRDTFDRDKGAYDDSTPTGHQRGRGVQFPFVVTDRVVIKGNKRTPQRFVGREAIVTTQCQNGWYVVKTVDNAESVKLQYRSLSKVAEKSSSSKPSPVRTIPNWL